MVLIVVVGSRCSGKNYFCEHHFSDLGLPASVSLKVIDLSGIVKVLQMNTIFHEGINPCGDAMRHTIILAEDIKQIAPDVRAGIKLFVFCEQAAMKKTLDLMHVKIPRQYNEAARDCFVVFNRTSEDFMLIQRTWPKSWTDSSEVDIAGMSFYSLRRN